MSSMPLRAPGALPDELAAWVTAAPAVLAATRGAAEWDARTRRDVLAALERVGNAVAVGKACVLNAEAQAGTWSLAGDRDLAGFVGRTSNGGRSAGLAAVEQAETLASLPAVADALVDGPVTVTHVEQIARVTASSPNLAAELTTPAGQRRLVELARRYDGAAFGRQLRAMGAAADPVSRQREHERQRAERHVTVTCGPSGTHIKGFLDAVSGYRFVKALDALDPRPAADDDRDRGKRRADALTAMADGVLRDPETTPGAVAPPQVIVTVSEETWNALRVTRAPADAGDAIVADLAAESGDRNMNARPGKGSTCDVVAALQGRTAVVDEDGSPWPASEVARLLCECELTRAVLGAEGEVLDLGHRERCFDRRHWKALLAVGWRTCAYPGCSMPLRWCQLHHLRWWSRAGGTDWNNLGPYCCFHHGLIHDRDIQIRRLPGGAYEYRRADGTLIGISRPGGVEAPGTDAASGAGAPPQGGGPSGGAVAGGGVPGAASRGAPQDDGRARDDMAGAQLELWSA